MHDNMIILNCKYLKFLACTSLCFVICLVDMIPFVWPLWSVAFSIALIVYSHCIRLHWIICIALLKIKKNALLFSVILNFCRLIILRVQVNVSQQSAFRCAASCMERIKRIIGVFQSLVHNPDIQSPLKILFY